MIIKQISVPTLRRHKRLGSDNYKHLLNCFKAGNADFYNIGLGVTHFRYLNKHHSFVYVEDKGKCLAFILMSKFQQSRKDTKKVAYASMIFTRAKHRRKGLVRAMLNYALIHNDLSRISWSCPEWNKPGHEAYKRICNVTYDCGDYVLKRKKMK